MKVTGNIVDLAAESIFWGTVHIESERISHIERLGEERKGQHYIMPGFTDAHIHVESSMLIPSQFARLAAINGTLATVSDPHEIANVCGNEGIAFMLEDAARVPIKIGFSVPSCVPATSFEANGATIDVADVKRWLQHPGMVSLGEMMNCPGVVSGDPDVMAKIESTIAAGKVVDGHAPSLPAAQMEAYFQAGVQTDHESTSYEEGLAKIKQGVNLQIREGSAARDFEALIPLIEAHPDKLLFCSDDKHPNEFRHEHINALAARAVAKDYPVMDVLKAACSNTAKLYKLPLGQLQRNDSADFIIVEDLKDFKVIESYMAGACIAREGQALFNPPAPKPFNKFNIGPIGLDELSMDPKSDKIRVIGVRDGELITDFMEVTIPVVENNLCSDVENDLLKFVVVNRYEQAPPAIGFVKNYGLKRGAIASTVAHDSHNIVAVGCSDEDLLKAINGVIALKGGQVVVSGEEMKSLQLPYGGLMTDMDAFECGAQYQKLVDMAHGLGTPLRDPFMSLSFMALPVIPQLKLCDKGLYDVENSRFVTLGVQ